MCSEKLNLMKAFLLPVGLSPGLKLEESDILRWETEIIFFPVFN